MEKVSRVIWCFAALFLAVSALRAVEISQAEFDRMKQDSADLDQLKKDVAMLRKAPQPSIVDSGAIEQCMENKYGGQPVVTGQGKLTIGGLVQIWYYGTQHDNKGLFNNPGLGISDSNLGKDNSSFRVRRAELNMEMDINSYVSSYVMVDFAREATSFQFLEDNQGNAFIPKTGLNGGPGGVQGGGGFTPAILQDALIHFHDCVPHHDFTVGQMLPTFSVEDFGPNWNLDFVERSFVGNHFARDLGAVVHGSWWDNGGEIFYEGAGDNGRFQYWGSVFDGASNYHSPEGTFQSQNRADDNNDKDFLFTTLVRPIWKMETWGNLELGYSGGFGRHGGSKVLDPINNPATDLNRRTTAASRSSAWLDYRPAGMAKGLWVKGEWAYVHDRNFPGLVQDLLNDPTGATAQSPAHPFSTTGFYAAAGYRIQEGCGTPEWASKFEFAFRYQQYTNVEIPNPVNPVQTNVYLTKQFTPGINYFLKGQNAKIQANYNFNENPSGPPGFKFHNVKNDSFALNFQVMF